ncbi:hypothetical protein QQG74_09095 [Micromonospora sp. FIMYZ51]|uniref:hypothetical protein n=1 Tax=Micromonospora sp. FIMYZ51 TaxID=3051832 RepID=UPI0031203D23
MVVTVAATLDNTIGERVTTQLAVERADRLGCGCTRYTCRRPGPPTGCQQVQLLTGCGLHPRDLED